MKKRYFAIICALLLVCCGLFGCKKQQNLEEWEKEEISRVRYSLASEIYYDADGNFFQLADNGLYEQPIVIHFWATRSPISLEGLDAWQEAYEQYGDQVQFLMINAYDGESDTIEDAQKLLEEKGYTFPVYYDREGNLGGTLMIEEFPYSLFLKTHCQLEHVRNFNLTLEQIGELIEDIVEE